MDCLDGFWKNLTKSVCPKAQGLCKTARGCCDFSLFPQQSHSVLSRCHCPVARTKQIGMPHQCRTMQTAPGICSVSVKYQKQMHCCGSYEECSTWKKLVQCLSCLCIPKRHQQQVRLFGPIQCQTALWSPRLVQPRKRQEDVYVSELSRKPSSDCQGFAPCQCW